jgi:UDPglucose 6-dehydrogenase
MREASSRSLLMLLWEAGAQVRAYDPEAMEETRRIFGERDDLMPCAIVPKSRWRAPMRWW